MKNFILLFVFCAMPVFSQTVINYDDGSTYTLKEKEVIHVVPEQRKLFTVQTYSKGDVIFRVQAPWAKRDYVETTSSSSEDFGNVDEYGFSQACADFDPSGGITFGHIWWQKVCDSNGDGEYNICDYYEPTGVSTFQEIQYQKQCLSNDGE